jgi:pyruvate kinase
MSAKTSDSNPHALLKELLDLRQAVVSEADALYQGWKPYLDRKHRPRFAKSALNFAQYLALRRRDLRDLQMRLRYFGLSSLGRIEAQVLPTLDNVIATLDSVVGTQSAIARPTPRTFEEGARLLERETRDVFGAKPRKRRVRVMVTLPSEAADDPRIAHDLLKAGMDVARINCAHDTPEAWARMIDHLRQAEKKLKRSCRVAMDLGGPKSRTTDVTFAHDEKRLHVGDLVRLSDSAPSAPPRDVSLHVRCTLPEAIAQAKVGERVFFDDGKIETQIIKRKKGELLLKVVHASPKGDKLKDDKGINFPDTALSLSPLTAQDLQDLDFVAQYADIVNYSFVQSGDDVRLLQAELQRRAPTRQPAIVAKIETAKAVKHLPQIIVAAGGRQPLGVMIARGDLAIELGYARLAEIQEEILWLCEAAHVPVIWATQVLETLAKEGRPSRAEVTDAAMSERAECVMLNKGEYIVSAMHLLIGVLERMETHQTKKTARLRALKSWQ